MTQPVTIGRATLYNADCRDVIRGLSGVDYRPALWRVGRNVYHHVSAKHLNRYVGEFAFRLNDGDVSRHTLQRLASMFDAAIGRRLTYAELIA